MIINPYVIILATEEDARDMKRELTEFFNTNKAADFPQLATILKNLNSILRK